MKVKYNCLLMNNIRIEYHLMNNINRITNQ